ALVAAEVAIERQTRGEHVVRHRSEHGLKVDTRGPDALLRLRQYVEAEHADWEKRGGCRRRKLDRKQILQQTFGPLVMRRQREVREPTRDRLRLVPHGRTIEIAVWQRGGVKEVRLREIGKSDGVHPPALITEAQCASIGELHEARQVQEPASGPRVRNLLTGANVGRIERIRKRAKGKAEVVVDRVGPAEGTGREQRPRILD